MATYTAHEIRNQAAALRFLARVMDTSPQGEFLEGLRLASSASPEGAVFWMQNEGRDPKDVEQDLRIDWTRLFRGLSAGYGPRPPYKLVYRSVDDEGRAMVAIKRMYADCGMAIADGFKDRPDHASLLLDCAVALLDEGKAPGQADGQADDRFVEFVQRNLGWIPEFCEEARPYAKTGLYRWYLDTLEAAVIEASAA